VRWVDDWPLMGEPIAGSSTTGQPVMTHAAPKVGRNWPPVAIQASDEFDSGKLEVQWEWNHNPLDGKWSLSARPGFLRLEATRAGDFVAARNTLTQVLHGPATWITTRVEIAGMRDGQRAGLAMLQVQPNWIGVVQTAGKRRITWSSAGAQVAGPVLEGDWLQLRVKIASEAAKYEYSLDGGTTFQPLGEASKLRFSWWKGARPALFSFSNGDSGGYADFDWLRVEPQR
jgi:beta-xylosidase